MATREEMMREVAEIIHGEWVDEDTNNTTVENFMGVAHSVMGYLHSQGVVIRIPNEHPYSSMLVIEPLIKE